MINEGKFKQKMYQFGANYDIDLKEKGEYLKFIYSALNNVGFNDSDFADSINKIMITKKTVFNKMPTLAMFLEFSDNKPLTLEDSSKVRVRMVMEFAMKQFYTSQFGIEVWDYAKYNKKFDDENINIMIQAEFGGIKGLLERFKEQKKNGYIELFRKELTSMFKTQDLVAQNNRIAIAKGRKEDHGDLIGNISKKLKINK